MAKFGPGIDPNAKPIPMSLWELIKFLYSVAKDFKGRFILGSIIRGLGEVSWLVWAYAIGSLTNAVIAAVQGGAREPINFWLTVLLLSGLIPTIFAGIGKWMLFTGPNLNSRVRFGILSLQHSLQLDLTWHESENTGNRIDRIDKGTGSAVAILDMWAQQVIPVLVTSIGTVAIFGKLNLPIAITMALFIVIYASLSIVLGKKVSTAVYHVRKQEEKIAGLSYELLNNIRTVKTIGSLLPIFNRVFEYYDTQRRLVKHRITVAQLRTYLPDILAQLFRMAVLLYIVTGILQGQYQVGFLALFLSYFAGVWDAASRLADVNQQYVINKNQVAELKRMLDEPIRIANETGKVSLPADWKTINLKDITFAYGENEVLKNLSLTIQRGQKVGIIGLSGAGKSTLFKLLLKEREGFSGEISFDETPLNTISANSYFSRVAVVLQETEVFNFSVTDNITIGSDGNVNQAQLEQALEVSHVKDFLHKLPDGLDTLIGEKGFKLSGGEKQRLGIARAVYKQPELLLLDEATSHLDMESEQKIQDSLHQFFDSVTAIVIAHRLTTIREMDVIVVIEDGQIIEQGSFDELMAKHGRFAELWDKQKI